jgi:hypothetical protein
MSTTLGSKSTFGELIVTSYGPPFPVPNIPVDVWFQISILTSLILFLFLVYGNYLIVHNNTPKKVAYAHTIVFEKNTLQKQY